MTIRECYAAAGGDYDEVLSRVRDEKMVRRFAQLFLADKSYEKICRALGEGRRDDAFHVVHSLRDAAENLGLSELQRASHALTEVLRAPESVIAESAHVFDRFHAVYHQTTAALRQMQENCG